ncbi:MAG: hypothetical protein WCI89_02800 [bacterium]
MPAVLKWVLVLVVLVGVGWLLWWSGWFKSASYSASTQGNAAGAVAATTTQAASAAPAPLNGMSVASDSSDPAIGQDTAAVDAQMQALDADGSQVTASLNDKPVAQSY